MPARIVFIRADGTRSGMAAIQKPPQWQNPDRTAKAALAASMAQKPRGPIEIPVLKAPADLLQDAGNSGAATVPTPIVQPVQQAPAQRSVPAAQSAHQAPTPHVPAAPSVGTSAAAPSRGLDRLAASARPKEPVRAQEQAFTQVRPIEQPTRPPMQFDEPER